MVHHWTLQERLAASVAFFSREGERLGDNSSPIQLIIEMTRFLPLRFEETCIQFSVAERM